MKKATVLLAVFCICFQAVAVFAATPDFSGEWELDASQSKLPDGILIDSIIMKISQTDKYLSVESETITNQILADGTLKRAAGKNIRNGLAHKLDGKEIRSVFGAGTATGEEIKKASLTTDGKLSATTIRNLKIETGIVVLQTNEIWELLDGGNTLKIAYYTESANGATNAEMFFKRKAAGIRTQIGGGAGTESVAGEKLARISGGVLNGKALRLVPPEYPAAARAVRASGAVNVQVTIDEQGNIVSANAVSGHPLLRAAAEKAAKEALFSPTLLEGVPVKIVGVIVYNFVP